LEGRTLDEAASHARRIPPRPDVCAQERAEDVRAYLPGKHAEDVSRSRRRTSGLRAIPRDPATGKGVCLVSEFLSRIRVTVRLTVCQSDNDSRFSFSSATSAFTSSAFVR